MENPMQFHETSLLMVTSYDSTVSSGQVDFNHDGMISQDWREIGRCGGQRDLLLHNISNTFRFIGIWSHKSISIFINLQKLGVPDSDSVRFSSLPQELVEALALAAGRRRTGGVVPRQWLWRRPLRTHQLPRHESGWQGGIDWDFLDFKLTLENHLFARVECGRIWYIAIAWEHHFSWAEDNIW